jgi:hypothetical protein
MSGIVGQNLGRGSGLIKAGAVDDNSITLAKMAGLARGKLIYGDASGDPAALAVGGADEVLTHDGTDFDWAAAGGGGKILQFATDSDGTAINLGADLDNWNDTLCNISFTPVESGSKLLVEANPVFYCDGDSTYFGHGQARFSIDGNETEAQSVYSGLGESGNYIDFQVGTEVVRHVYTTTGTSAIVVKLQVQAKDGGDCRYMHYSGQCVMTIMEIGS